MRSTDDLERELRGADRHLAGAPDLDLIRRHGRRRRQARAALVTGGGLLATAVLAGVGLGLSGLGDGGGREGAPASVTLQEHEAPETLHPLAERALREIPGAVKVSATQVVIPAPGVAEEGGGDAIGENGRPPLVGTPVALTGHVYAGVTSYAADAFPAWLHAGVSDFETTVLANGNSAPVGSTDIGILVDQGVAQLGCKEWDSSERHDNANCWATVMTQVGEKRYVESSLGTDSFLTPGAPMEVFLSDDFSTGRRTTLAIAGLDGTDVARVEFVPTSGAPVTGTVQSGTITQGDSFFYANVPGTLWKVVAYDAAGKVIEDHPLRDCDAPVECEVR